MFIRNRKNYKRHPVIVAWGINVVSKMRYLRIMLDSQLDWYPHTQYLENKLLHIRNSLICCSKATWGMSFYNLMAIYKYAILPAITYTSEAWSTSISKRVKIKLQKIQRSFLTFITKAYRRVSHEALSATAGIMPIDQVTHLYKDIKAVITELKKIEIPIKTKGIHPKDNHILVDLSGIEGNTNVATYMYDSKKEKHVGASMVAMKISCEVHIETQRLNITCTVFQAELCRIIMAIDCIQCKLKKTSSYAINVDSKAALLAIANKHTTHPLATATRMKITELRKSTSIAVHSVKAHIGLEGNEKADFLAKTVASYNTTVAYDAIPINQGKQILENCYVKIWNVTYINSANTSHTKLFIPTIFYRLPLSLWPNFILTQFLTNDVSFHSYLHKMNKMP
jgi:ribonuclease HI